MKRDNGWIKSATWISSCVLFGVSLNALPAQASTFSRTESNFSFRNFSDSALSNSTFTDTDTFSFSNGGPVLTDANADALFINDPAQANNFVRTEAFVNAPSAFGFAGGESSVIGNFRVGSGTFFSFDFFGSLDVVATVDYPSQEIATAASSVIFSVFDITNTTPVILDIFEFAAGVSTGDNNDFLALNVNEKQNFSFNQSRSFASLDFDGNTEGVQAQVEGRYNRLFGDETLVSLVEVKQGNSTGNSQSIPEPTTSILIGSLISGGFLFKKKAKQ